MKTVFLFPGQGSQQVGMLSDLQGSDPIVKAVFEEAESFLGKSVLKLDEKEGLASSTVNVQLCLLVAGVISARQLINKGIKPDFVAGHSIGAFSAAVISRVLSFQQAIKLVNLRAKMMQEAFPVNYGMVALVGFSENRLNPYLIRHNANHSPVYLANINAADQLVVAGRTDSMEMLVETLKKDGIQKTKVLNVSVPSHCELLSNVSNSLKAEMLAMKLNDPAILYAANVTGRLLRNAEAVRQDLWASVSSTVRWYDATSLIYECGGSIFIEMAPAGVLAKIAEATFQEAKVIAYNPQQINQTDLLWNNFKN